MTPRGLLIAFEGGEGAGKSTQAERLARSRGALLTREPGGTELGERIRSALLTPAGFSPAEASVPAVGVAIDPRAELMLLLAARAQHVAEVIAPGLGSGRDVVVDRFNGSTLAYQGYGRRLPLDEIRDACNLATGGVWPDITILVHVPAGVGAGRRARAGAPLDRIEAEGEGFHERVGAGFLELAETEPTPWVVVDGTPEVEVVARLVEEAVTARLTR